MRLGHGLGMSRSAARSRGQLSPLTLANSSYIDYYDPTNAASISPAGGPILRIHDPRPSPFVISPRFYQPSSALRPTVVGGRAVFDGTTKYLDHSRGYTPGTAILLGDPFYCQAGKGPTGCGIDFFSDGRMAIAHYGKKHQSTAAGETFDGGICIYAATGNPRQLLQEIRLQTLGISGAGPQGLVIDQATGLIYLADPAQSKIYVINPTGPVLTATLSVAVAANGLALNTITGHLMVFAAANTMTIVNKATGATVSTIATAFRDSDTIDMLRFYDDDPVHYPAGILYVSCRDNGEPGRMIKYDLVNSATPTPVPLDSWTYLTLLAQEGMARYQGVWYHCSDEYYHAQAANVNYVQPLTLNDAKPDYGTRLLVSGVCKIAATPAATVALFHGGDSIGRSGIGAFFTTTVNQFRVIFRVLPGLQATADFVNPAGNTADFGYDIDADAVAGTIGLWINGSFVSTFGPDAKIAGIIPNMFFTQAASREASGLPTRFANVSIGGFRTYTNPALLAATQGDLMWKAGIQASLPGGHLYKNAAPN